MSRKPAGPRALELIEPLKVVAGGRETAATVLTRLLAQRAHAAPVFERGRIIGLIPRSLVQDAVRHGLGDVPVRELVAGGAPSLGPRASLAAMRRKCVGIAPALVVKEPAGPILGLVRRDRIDGSGTRFERTRNVSARLGRLLDPARSEMLSRAGLLAARRGSAVYLAGGVVRDLLRGVAAKDLDLVVEGDGGAFAMELGRELGAPQVTRHDAFGTAVIELADGGRLDVATARRESYDAPASLPRVSPGTFFEDMRRRDVTINSLALRLDAGAFGELVDLLGGERDLRAGILRVNHMLSITEDPTRAFRIARFAARFRFRISGETRASLDLARRAGAFDALGGERLLHEFSLITTEPDPVAALSGCARLGLLAHLGPGLRWDAEASRGMRHLVSTWNEETTPQRRVILVLMALAWRARPDQRRDLALRLKISGKPAERMREVPAAARALARALDKARGARAVVRACEKAPHDVMALAWAIGGARARDGLRSYMQRLRALRLAVTGATLGEMGMPAGPGYAAVLGELRRARLEGRIADDDSERSLAARLIARHARRDSSRKVRH